MPSIPKNRTPVDARARVKASPTRTEAVQVQVIAEQRKEIARLQKSLARLEVKKDSEIAALRAKLAEEKKSKVNVIIQRFGEAL